MTLLEYILWGNSISSGNFDSSFDMEPIKLGFYVFRFSLFLPSGYYIDNSSYILFFRVQSLSTIYLQRAQVYAETSVLKKTPSAQ